MKLKAKAKIYGLTAVVIAASLTGCHAIYDESDCVESFNTVRFEYTHNMKFADAFVPEVDHVTMLVFDSSTGKLVQRKDIPKADLRDGNKTDLAVEPGEYDILVWGGDLRTDYELAAGETGASAPADFHCYMKRELTDGTHNSRADLAPLFHGMVHLSLPYAAPSKPNEVVIPVMKDTNVIRVVLQHISGEVVDHSKFDFTITDANGWLNHDNSLRDANTIINYHPWRTVTGAVDVNTNPKSAPGSKASSAFDAAAGSRAVLGASLAEFTVNRLFASNNPVLTVTDRDTGTPVLSVPVKDYALLVKGFYHEQMDDQEYLDRQDEYNMTFFLDDGNRWLSSVIIINDWRIVRHEVPLE